MIVKLAIALALSLIATGALAAPTLRGDVTVNKAVITVGDMFDGAGLLAETGIFLAPAPGTTGIVPLVEVERAAARIGLTGFDNAGFTRVRVARSATTVDAALLEGLVAEALQQRGLVVQGTTPAIRFASPIDIKAEDVAQPATLLDVNYAPGGRSFAARFLIAGIDRPLDLSGSVDLLAEAPRLIATRPAGSILSASDFEIVQVPVATLDAGNFAGLDQLVGKQLVRAARAGLMLKASDVRVPTVVNRNTVVTVVLQAGAMTLTVTGTALGSAAPGEAVDVLNPVTKKILHGVARANGTVEIPTVLSVAGL
jgi:flagella basal body P-ring formation protein FlgA